MPRWKIGDAKADPPRDNVITRGSDFALARHTARSILQVMITELGHFALILAFCTACFQAVVPLVGAQRRMPGWMAVAEPAATVQCERQRRDMPPHVPVVRLRQPGATVVTELCWHGNWQRPPLFNVIHE